jgi:xanthine dehydrogenase iron-sulfur cluster and FAD-binding subunit A
MVKPTHKFALADLSADEIPERMSGNLCRCACYPKIVQAVTDAAVEAKPCIPSPCRAAAPPAMAISAHAPRLPRRAGG